MVPSASCLERMMANEMDCQLVVQWAAHLGTSMVPWKDWKLVVPWVACSARKRVPEMDWLKAMHLV